MSLEITSETVQTPKTRYDQVQHETVTSTPNTTAITSHGRGSRSDRDLVSTSHSERTSGQKTSIAFNLSFKIKIANRTPFDPGNHC